MHAGLIIGRDKELNFKEAKMKNSETTLEHLNKGGVSSMCWLPSLYRWSRIGKAEGRIEQDQNVGRKNPEGSRTS